MRKFSRRDKRIMDHWIGSTRPKSIQDRSPRPLAFSSSPARRASLFRATSALSVLRSDSMLISSPLHGRPQRPRPGDPHSWLCLQQEYRRADVEIKKLPLVSMPNQANSDLRRTVFEGRARDIRGGHHLPRPDQEGYVGFSLRSVVMLQLSKPRQPREELVQLSFVGYGSPQLRGGALQKLLLRPRRYDDRDLLVHVRLARSIEARAHIKQIAHDRANADHQRKEDPAENHHDFLHGSLFVRIETRLKPEAPEDDDAEAVRRSRWAVLLEGIGLRFFWLSQKATELKVRMQECDCRRDQSHRHEDDCRVDGSLCRDSEVIRFARDGCGELSEAIGIRYLRN